METPELIVLNLILLMLVFTMNVKVHAGTITDALEVEAHHCADVWNDKNMAVSPQSFDYTDSETERSTHAEQGSACQSE